MTDLAVIKQQC